ncbi:MAG: sigma-70 family RNA polymerase sigma factor [Acidobacteria bacterium]|nr:MAG: sigma-70 family RNA polymerase sigma factor [Acidobacteriota bacterium]
MDALQHRELQELLARLADGDRAAFPPAFRLLWPVTRSFAGSFLGDAAGAEDAAQQALVRLFLRAAEFDATRDALPWVLGIVANECRTLRRRTQRRREGPLDAAAARPAPGPTPEDDATGRDLERAALETLAGLPPADVEAVLAHIGRGERPDLPAATFRKRLQRALKRLRRAWSERHGTL